MHLRWGLIVGLGFCLLGTPLASAQAEAQWHVIEQAERDRLTREYQRSAELTQVVEMNRSMVDRDRAIAEERLNIARAYENLSRPKDESIKAKDVVGWLISAIAPIIAAALALNLFQRRVDFDQWEKTRNLEIAEYDKKIATLTSIATKVYDLVRVYNEYNRILEPLPELKAVGTHDREDVFDVEMRWPKKGASDRVDELEGLIAVYRSEIVTLGLTYGYLPYRVGLSLDVKLGTQIGDVSEEWANNVEEIIAASHVSDTKWFPKRMKRLIDDCIDSEQERKTLLVESPYPSDAERRITRNKKRAEEKEFRRKVKELDSFNARQRLSAAAERFRNEDQKRSLSDSDGN